MAQARVPAVFMRGGTSKGVFFHARDLPAGRDGWNAVFRAAIGSPDPYERQLNGLGGGISSLSKAVVIAPSSRPGIDVDFTFAQVDVVSELVDYGATCGNLSSAVGPFAIDEGLIQADGPEALVRVFNTNTDKVFEARFALDGGAAAVAGDFVIPGVAGSGARIRLDFLDPGGAGTGRLLPTGNPTDILDVPGLGPVRCSMIDSTNACVFVAAADVGLMANELPQALEQRRDALDRLEAIRAAAGVAMGYGATVEDVTRRSKSAPKIAVVAPPVDAVGLDGATQTAAAMDLAVRMISMNRPHRAVPLSGGLCLAVAARIEGSVVHAAARATDNGLRLGTPSGILPLAAEVTCEDGVWRAVSATVYRTARRLMEGNVLLPG